MSSSSEEDEGSDHEPDVEDMQEIDFRFSNLDMVEAQEALVRFQEFDMSFLGLFHAKVQEAHIKLSYLLRFWLKLGVLILRAQSFTSKGSSGAYSAGV